MNDQNASLSRCRQCEIAPREASVRDNQPYLHELGRPSSRRPALALSGADGQLTGRRRQRGLPGRPPGALPARRRRRRAGARCRSAASRRTRDRPVRRRRPPPRRPGAGPDRVRGPRPHGLAPRPARDDPARLPRPRAARPARSPRARRRPGRHRRGQGRPADRDAAVPSRTSGPPARCAGRSARDRGDRDPLPRAGRDRAPAAPSRVLAAWDVALPARVTGRRPSRSTATAPARARRSPRRRPASCGAAPAVDAGDHRLPALVERSVADLAGLLLADPAAPTTTSWPPARPGTSRCSAATRSGPPGCCCRWAPTLAAGTLRTLARRQGARLDPGTDEEPGKILHEVRPHRRRPGTALPPLYYGTVDATPLWISCCTTPGAGACPTPRWRALLPQPGGARWAGCATRPGDGFVAYRRQRRRGLANQGWKDSATPSSSPTAGSPTRRSRCARCRRTRTRRPLEGADAARRVRPAGGDRWRAWAAALRGPVPRARSGSTTGRPLPGDRAGRRRAAGRLAHLQHRPPARHRPAGRRPRAARWSPAGRAGHGLRLRAAHDVVALGRVQPAQLPRRLGLAARHRDRAARAGRGRHRRRRTRPRQPGPRAARRRAGVRLPAAGAVRRRVRGRRPAAAGLPGGLPAAGLVGRGGPGRAHRDRSAWTPTCRPAGSRCARCAPPPSAS